MVLVAAVLLVVVSAGAWLLNLLGLPGNWIVLAGGALYTHFGPRAGRLDIGWGVVGALLALAVLGELIEFFAAIWGTQRAGGSWRGAALALLGSVVGGIIGLFVGLPIPVIGSLLAALLCASFGASVGAVIGERWTGRDFDTSLKIGGAAFWSRMAGTIAKSVAGALMVALLCGALLF